MNEIFFITLGLLGLWFGSDFAVEAARRIAVKLKVSDLIIGLTITSIGTSLPEISTNILAGFSTLAEKDASGIAVGNIIGSDLAQITLLLGIVGFLATLTIPMRSLKRDGFMLFIALILMYITAIDGHVSRGEGVILVLAYIIYLIYLLNQERVLENKKTKSKSEKRDYKIGIDLIKTIVGLTVVVVSAYLIVENGVSMALQIGITESVIGIFVGLGTSIPELTVSLRAIKERAGELSLGNLIGSNITDPLLSFGLGASVAGVTISQSVLQFDFVYWMAATTIALFLIYNHMNLNRKESSVLIILYLLFIYLKLTFFLTK
ncbi:MAG: hypothetical protein DRO76_00045 [Candidatus Altiarchaeales archaeon]|nr:MAG: hypothetical protein DRO76_00045 [Candidatus Altiarchaeales archaeon]